jgi:hypothetical protein
VTAIGVRNGGTLNFYGKVRGPTWTRLASTVNVGATSITLIEAVEWAVGDVIVIAPTDFPSWQDPNNPWAWEGTTSFFSFLFFSVNDLDFFFF